MRNHQLLLPLIHTRGYGQGEGDKKAFEFPIGAVYFRCPCPLRWPPIAVPKGHESLVDTVSCPLALKSISGILDISGGTSACTTESCFWSGGIGIECPGHTVSHAVTSPSDYCFLQPFQLRESSIRTKK